MKNQTREQWLNALAVELQKEFKPEGLKLPKHRITCGFPSKGGLAVKKRTIGQCWTPEASADGTTEIIIGITQDEPMTVAGVLAHEMVHAVVTVEAGHRKPFRDMALAIGLQGKMVETKEGPEFIKRVTPLLKKIGTYEHARLDPNVGKKTQSTRMIKISCIDEIRGFSNQDGSVQTCGMVFRASNKWVIDNTLACPRCGGDTKIG